mgnify:FL=1
MAHGPVSDQSTFSMPQEATARMRYEQPVHEGDFRSVPLTAEAAARQHLEHVYAQEQPRPEIRAHEISDDYADRITLHDESAHENPLFSESDIAGQEAARLAVGATEEQARSVEAVVHTAEQIAVMSTAISGVRARMVDSQSPDAVDALRGAASRGDWRLAA